MKDMGIVQGSGTQAVPLIVGVDTVYVHTDIEKIEGTDMDGNPIENSYKYHEIQYSHREYIELLGSENSELKTQIDSQKEQNLNTQMALVDMYETMIGYTRGES